MKITLLVVLVLALTLVIADDRFGQHKRPYNGRIEKRVLHRMRQRNEQADGPYRNHKRGGRRFFGGGRHNDEDDSRRHGDEDGRRSRRPQYCLNECADDCESFQTCREECPTKCENVKNRRLCLKNCFVNECVRNQTCVDCETSCWAERNQCMLDNCANECRFSWMRMSRRKHNRRCLGCMERLCERNEEDNQESITEENLTVAAGGDEVEAEPLLMAVNTDLIGLDLSD